MTLRDLFLVLGAMPLLGVVAWRLAAETGLAVQAPPSDALRTALGLFGVVFVLYVALTLRAIASATRAILARDAEPEQPRADRRKTAVSDFAIHLDRSAEVDLREASAASGDPGALTGADVPSDEPALDADDALPPDDEPRPAGQTPRRELFGEVNDLLTRIPSARSR
jgi:hypothetical protein